MAKGIKTGGGSRKGRPNKNNAPLFEMIDQALIGVGGVEYLKQQAIENPVAFMSLIGKRLPKEINGSMDHSHDVAVTSIKLIPMVANGSTDKPA